MPNVKMELTSAAHKEFKTMMKKVGYDDTDAFLKYCVLKTIKPYASKADQKLIAKEIASLQRTRVK